MVKKRADEEIISNDDFENEDSINLEENSNFEDEANEEEKDVKPFTGSELSDWEDRRESNSQDTKKPKDESIVCIFPISLSTILFITNCVWGCVRYAIASKKKTSAFFFHTKSYRSSIRAPDSLRRPCNTM